MLVERNVLISVLKLTKNGAIRQEELNLDVNVPSSVVKILLEKLQNENLVYLKDGFVEVTAEGRLSLAVKAVQSGADVERVSDFLHWREFEGMASLALEFNGYSTARNVHFKNGKKRWELDVVGCKKPLVVCTDCKHWHHGLKSSSLRTMVESQISRVEAFAESFPNKALALTCSKWENATFVPVIMSLTQSSFRLYYGVPIVPVLQLQDFIHHLPLNLDSVKTFTRKFEHL